MSARQAKGAAAEQLAADYLCRRGLALVERNFRVRGGEIDLVCRDGKTTVFVEVRSRSSGAHGGAAASIGLVKQRRIIFAARHYLLRQRQTPPCRFDVVLVESAGVQWLQAAFDAS